MTKNIFFGTSNLHKLAEAEGIFQGKAIKIIHYPVDLLEIQDSNVENIAVYSLKMLPQTEYEIFVEDTGLFIESLKGFPGPYASQTFKTIGNPGIMKLLEGEQNRKAYFESCVSFRDNKGDISSFIGRCDGSIAEKIDGEMWGFDPIFIPHTDLNPGYKTFSRLGEDVKNKISHRAKALEKLKDFIVSKYQV